MEGGPVWETPVMFGSASKGIAQGQSIASGPDSATGPSAQCRVVAGFKGGAGRYSWKRTEVAGGALGDQRRRGSAIQGVARVLQVKL